MTTTTRLPAAERRSALLDTALRVFSSGSYRGTTTAAAMRSVPVDKAGVGSAVINSMRQVGGSLGIAVMGAVVATQIHGGARATPEEFVTGYHHALYVGAAISLAGAAIAVLTVRQIRHPHPAGAPEPAIGS